MAATRSPPKTDYFHQTGTKIDSKTDTDASSLADLSYLANPTDLVVGDEYLSVREAEPRVSSAEERIESKNKPSIS